MKHFFRLLLVVAIITSCKDDKKESQTKTITKPETETKVFDDSAYVLDDKFPIGDVRRYGVYPDSSYSSRHPYTKLSKLRTVLDLAEQHGIEMFFPKGYYKRPLILDSRRGLTLRFDGAEFDVIHITHNTKDKIKPKDITLKGSMISYDRLGITEATNIDIDTVYLKSDPQKNLRNLRSRGCHIYHGCNDIKIKYLEIDDFGSGTDKYKYNHAALSIDGYNNNPENVQIKKVLIKSTDRHGIYLTGKDHLIGDVVIEKFGVGSSKDMAPMQDAAKGEEKDFKALWVNKCYDSFIENITINEKESKGKYTVHFDTGNKQKPVTIGAFKVINDNPNIELLEEPKNGVVIEDILN